MTALEYLAVFTLISPAILWVFFYLLFNTWAGMTQSKSYSYLYMLVGSVGIVIDVYVNLWASVMFLQAPDINRMLLSARLDDLIKNGTGWRKSLATWIVGVFLEPYDLTKQHTTYGAFNAGTR
jgi:hypothetical protein